VGFKAHPLLRLSVPINYLREEKGVRCSCMQSYTQQDSFLASNNNKNITIIPTGQALHRFGHKAGVTTIPECNNFIMELNFPHFKEA
jgi:hypothetical protein